MKEKSDVVRSIFYIKYSDNEIAGLVKKAEIAGYSKARDIGPWQFYLKGKEEFFAFGKQERKGDYPWLIVHGISPVETAHSDLEHMAGLLRNRNLFSGKSHYGALLGAGTFSVGFLTYIYGFKHQSWSEGVPDKFLAITLLGEISAAIVGWYLMTIIGKAYDRNATREISDTVLGYDYSYSAKVAIESEASLK